MRNAPLSAPLAATLMLCALLAGCNNQPEETPNLEEAIPLDNPADAAEDGTADEDTDAGASAAPADDSVGEDAGDSGSTMQSGSNADSGRAVDPSRTKLIPAD